jgi:hypothetical protein
MIQLIIQVFKFAFIGYLIIFGMSYYDNSKPIYLQNILFWIFVFIPCVGAYEGFLSFIVKKWASKQVAKDDKVKKTFSEKLAEKIADAEIKK